MSGLVAAPEYEGVSGKALLDATPAAGNIASAAEDFGNGNIGSGIIDVAGGVLDTVGLIANPIAALAGSCASFLMDHIGPLHRALESVTGSPEMVRALSETWDNLAEALNEIADDHRAAANRLVPDWAGDAARSYGLTAERLEQVIATIGTSCHNVALGFRVAATIVEIVYEIVKGIIADLVGMLIQAVAEALATLGIGIPFIAGQCAQRIAQRVPQVMRWVEKVQDAMRTVNRVVGQLTQFGHIFEGRVDVVAESLGRVVTVPMNIDIAAVDIPAIVQAGNSSYKDNWTDD
ncbi:hypothetical protein PU630_14005 [Microbacterium horticulturae]|uniref:Outer membrane channel protein CpnT-like N-terminal domain-containing protein n=1 Tax=Microbacterium horticulturae TaxID=3028316 RepID=A0ABY8BVZ4_9MICO|nr:hypothetical protein [Microbacterium sp. KACC 23027]WEG08339.1 hypothetical protein PU630_14005 [Microbacterium sp. KACC 23027]